MNRENFISRMKTADGILNKELVINTIKQSIRFMAKDNSYERGHMNLIIVMEELSELIKEVSKGLRGRLNRTALLEELADVQTAIFYIQEIFDIPDEELNKAINVKTENHANALTALTKRSEQRKE